jgi:hypothetical protein
VQDWLSENQVPVQQQVNNLAAAAASAMPTSLSLGTFSVHAGVVGVTGEWGTLHFEASEAIKGMLAHIPDLKFQLKLVTKSVSRGACFELWAGPIMLGKVALGGRTETERRIEADRRGAVSSTADDAVSVASFQGALGRVTVPRKFHQQAQPGQWYSSESDCRACLVQLKRLREKLTLGYCESWQEILRDLKSERQLANLLTGRHLNDRSLAPREVKWGLKRSLTASLLTACDVLSGMWDGGRGPGFEASFMVPGMLAMTHVMTAGDHWEEVEHPNPLASMGVHGDGMTCSEYKQSKMRLLMKTTNYYHCCRGGAVRGTIGEQRKFVKQEGGSDCVVKVESGNIKCGELSDHCEEYNYFAVGAILLRTFELPEEVNSVEQAEASDRLAAA